MQMRNVVEFRKACRTRHGLFPEATIFFPNYELWICDTSTYAEYKYIKHLYVM